MLANNFKTAADLGLSEKEFRALVTVLGMLDRGEIAYSPRGEATDRLGGAAPIGFNMWHFFGKTECGTICCICGWAEYVGNLRPESLIKKRFDTPQLNELFDPPSLESVPVGVCDKITTAQAAHALRNYLTTGEARWSEVLPTHAEHAGEKS